MAEYGKTLKQLIDFSSVKMYLVAESSRIRCFIYQQMV